MTDPLHQQDDAATPLTPEEREALIPSYITLRRELNEAEQANILEAESWAFGRRRDVLEERFLKNLHKRMLGKVWRWAGSYRRSERKPGVEAWRIPQDMGQLIGDCRYWIDHKVYEPDETAARFHHKLVWIRAFPNGNGRHARLAPDLLLTALGRERFSWGRVNLVDHTATRKAYVAALQAADNYDITHLMAFVRS